MKHPFTVAMFCAWTLYRCMLPAYGEAKESSFDPAVVVMMLDRSGSYAEGIAHSETETIVGGVALWAEQLPTGCVRPIEFRVYTWNQTTHYQFTSIIETLDDVDDFAQQLAQYTDAENDTRHGQALLTGVVTLKRIMGRPQLLVFTTNEHPTPVLSPELLAIRSEGVNSDVNAVGYMFNWDTANNLKTLLNLLGFKYVSTRPVPATEREILTDDLAGQLTNVSMHCGS
jgi:hypothetical protein